ncbi:MAG: PEP-CTERM sorting domain-containing protein [Pseudomonadota bacterium]
MTRQIIAIAAGFGLAMGLSGGAALADSIDPPLVIDDTLAVGDSRTVEKTVTISAGDPTSALIDTFFLFDTSGSMGAAIEDAQSASDDILSGLAGFGDLAAGVGVYAEQASLTLPLPGRSINQDLTTSVPTAETAIGNVTLGNPDGGGDFLENGNTAIEQVAENASWRPGSNRFLIVLGDAGFKDSGVDDVASEPISSDADAIAALAAEGINLIGLNFGTGSFESSVEDLGGDVFSGGSLPDDIVDAITAGITGSFAEYGTVTVDDLGNGLPLFSVSTICTGADIGACVGSDAVGDYDREEERVFTFDVTFTRLAEGDADFNTFALVDGGIVATERDVFGGGELGEIPVPPALALMGLGLAGFGWLRRRRA